VPNFAVGSMLVVEGAPGGTSDDIWHAFRVGDAVQGFARYFRIVRE